MPRPPFRLSTAGIASILWSACALSTSSFPPDSTARPMPSLPTQFLVLEGSSTRPAKPGEGCRTPLLDPASGVRLTLVRSRSQRGDYHDDSGRLGLARGELVRLDCATGRTFGIVLE